jgi:soluble lytic murein transglycosylase-like protein
MWKIKISATLALLLATAMPALAGEIYKYVDKWGRVHFSDQPFNKNGTPMKRTPTPAPPAPSEEAEATETPAAETDSGGTAVRIYKYVDPRGVIHLTDRPQDGRYKLIYSGTTLSYASAPPSLVDLSTEKLTGSGFELYAPIIAEIAQRNNLEPALVHAVIKAESAYNSDAVSPKGAVGLMQLIPGTARRYGVSDSYDPVENISGGTRYLRDLLDLFNNDMQLALAGYNAGENAVIRNGYQIPPYAETRYYVTRVMSLYQAYSAQLAQMPPPAAPPATQTAQR